MGALRSSSSSLLGATRHISAPEHSTTSMLSKGVAACCGLRWMVTSVTSSDHSHDRVTSTRSKNGGQVR